MADLHNSVSLIFIARRLSALLDHDAGSSIGSTHPGVYRETCSISELPLECRQTRKTRSYSAYIIPYSACHASGVKLNTMHVTRDTKDG